MTLPPTAVLTVDGLSLRIVDTGPRDAALLPLVLVHGLGGSLENWAYNLAHFAGTRRTIALDLPGHGESDKPAEAPYSIEFFAKTVEHLLVQLGIPRAIWIGNSMGGHISTYAAIHHPERIAAIVLTNAAGANVGLDFDRLPVNPRMLVNFDLGALDLGAFTLDDAMLDRFLAPLFSNPDGPVARELKARVRRDAGRPDTRDRIRAVIRAAVSIADTPLTEHFAKVRVPTLVVWGMDDRLLSRRNAEALATITGAELVKLERTGHMPQMESPEAYHGAVDPFIARVG